MRNPIPRHARAEMRLLEQDWREQRKAPRGTRFPPRQCKTNYAKTRNWMSPPEASYYLFGNFDRVQTLEDWRLKGTGPKSTKAGRMCVYRQDWLDDWLKSVADGSVRIRKSINLRPIGCAESTSPVIGEID